MQFLTDDDFDVQTRTELMQVLKVSTTSLPNAEGMAQEQMIGYLRPRGYDVTAIFAATDVSRNPLIIMYLIDMVIYHLYSNTAARVMPKMRDDRYAAALDWLKKVNTGDLDPTLPKIDGFTPDPIYRFGSDHKTFKRW